MLCSVCYGPGFTAADTPVHAPDPLLKPSVVFGFRITSPLYVKFLREHGCREVKVRLPETTLETSVVEAAPAETNSPQRGSPLTATLTYEVKVNFSEIFYFFEIFRRSYLVTSFLRSSPPQFLLYLWPCSYLLWHCSLNRVKPHSKRVKSSFR